MSATRGGGKLSLLCKLKKRIDLAFEFRLLRDKKQNCLLRLFNLIDDAPDMITSFMDSVLDRESQYYELGTQVFEFDEYSMGLTLEDVLFITGLPIQGKPVLFAKSSDNKAFFRVFKKYENMTTVPATKIVDICCDMNETYKTRKIALCLVMLFAFIAPDNDKHEIDSVSVQFVENLNEIDDYAWGTALLAYIYNGMNRFTRRRKSCVDGNLWILLAFFLIRINKLQNRLGISLRDPPQSVRGGDPWLPWILREIKKKSHNHYAKYDISSMLPFSDEDINWTPYANMVCPLPRDLDSVRDLTPIFCYNVVVYHKPHHCRKQFPKFDSYDLVLRGWDECEVGEPKQRKGGIKDYFDLYKNAIAAWNARLPAENYMHIMEEDNQSPEDSEDSVYYRDTYHNEDGTYEDEDDMEDTEHPEDSEEDSDAYHFGSEQAEEHGTYEHDMEDTEHPEDSDAYHFGSEQADEHDRERENEDRDDDRNRDRDGNEDEEAEDSPSPSPSPMIRLCTSPGPLSSPC